MIWYEQVREKSDKFQQRRLDGFFKAGLKAADEGTAAEEPEGPAMPEVMAMEIEMEVWRPSVHTKFTFVFEASFRCRTMVAVNAASGSLLMQT